MKVSATPICAQLECGQVYVEEQCPRRPVEPPPFTIYRNPSYRETARISTSARQVRPATAAIRPSQGPPGGSQSMRNEIPRESSEFVRHREVWRRTAAADGQQAGRATLRRGVLDMAVALGVWL